MGNSRPLSPDDKALRRARIDDFCARHGVITAPPTVERELDPAEILALGVGRKYLIYGRKKLQRADIAKARKSRRGTAPALDRDPPSDPGHPGSRSE